MNTLSTIRNVFLFVVLCTSFTLDAQARKVRALFIGNSYTEFNNLPAIINNLALASGDTLEFSKSTPGGATLEGHSMNPSTLALIEEGNWDYVILQEQSQIPSFPNATVNSDFYPYVVLLDSLVKAHNPCATTLMYMTWGRKNGDASNCPYWPPICTYSGMDSLLRLRYQAAADEIGAGISPVGPVWRHIRAEHPSIELYTADESHPSSAGSFAAACAFYTVIFKKNPALNPYNYTLTAAQATSIKDAAAAIAFDSLSTWLAHLPAITAGYSFEATELIVSFENESENASSFFWDFGDGHTSEEAHPTHTYESAGEYEVSLVANRCSHSDTFITTLSLGTTGWEDINNSPSFAVYPNPAQDRIYIADVGQVERIEMLNLKGQILSFKENVYQNTYFQTSDLVPGIYFLRIINQNKSTIVRFVKQ